MVVECIGVEFQSCCSQSGATSAYNTCLDREVGRAALHGAENSVASAPADLCQLAMGVKG